VNVARRILGFERSTTPVVEAACVQCGDTFRVLLPDVRSASRACVDHRCGHGVCGPVWSLTVPPLPRAADIKPARRRRAA
jgi:hypothetical protein